MNDKPTEAANESADTKGVPPMTASLMGRLFIVPALIVSLGICFAIVIVLFGSVSVGQRPSIDKLLNTIESGTGERSAGVMLMPASREVWQAAQELALRLERKDKELTSEQVEPTSQRIERILKSLPEVDPQDEAVQPKRVFLIVAMGRLGAPSAAPFLAKELNHRDPRTRQAALQALMEMRNTHEARQEADHVIPLLDDAAHEVQMIACAAVGVLSEPGDRAAISALRRKLDADPEVQWNAALALARLGHPSCKIVLLNMLDRNYWEKSRVQYQEGSQTVDRSFTPGEVENYLCVSIDAAAAFPDADLRRSIDRLRKDPAATVRTAADHALSHKPATERAA